jgi:tetratricopeptide (TPR) repeat protein
MEETFLSRFDALDVRVRKILQTCAVLGQSFELADVACVHVEIAEQEIENALNSAVDEMILVEQIDEDRHREGVSLNTDPHDFDTSLGDLQPVQRYFQFSHAMWRKNVLSTMLKERKAELHRLVALSMEKDQSLIPEESDISRLLKLFEHWKSCGDFCKAAPLALAIGARLEEWDLSDQSLELYEDALETAFSSVEETDQVSSSGNKEFVQVKARPLVLDLILRLHICIGLCHQRLGQEQESIYFFEDAFHIIQTSSKMVGICKSLRMPIISSLCVLRLETEYKEPDDIQILESLIGEFVREAEEEGTPIHIGRSLAMQASYYARMGHFEDALEWMTQLTIAYNIEQNSADMIAEYGRDFAIECLSESIHWLYLLGLRSEAEKRASIIIKKYLSLLDPCDTDSVLRVLFPIIQVYGLLDRGRDAEELLQTHIIKPFHDQEVLSDLWSPLFNPLVYLLDVIIMEESGTVDKTVLEDLKNWVLEENHDVHEMEIERKNRTVLGELCWRLLKLVGERDTENEALVQKAREFLEPVANGEHSELFQKRTAQAILAAL